MNEWAIDECVDIRRRRTHRKPRRARTLAFIECRILGEILSSPRDELFIISIPRTASYFLLLAHINKYVWFPLLSADHSYNYI